MNRERGRSRQLSPAAKQKGEENPKSAVTIGQVQRYNKNERLREGNNRHTNVDSIGTAMTREN